MRLLYSLEGICECQFLVRRLHSLEGICKCQFLVRRLHSVEGICKCKCLVRFLASRHLGGEYQLSSHPAEIGSLGPAGHSENQTRSSATIASKIPQQIP